MAVERVDSGRIMHGRLIQPGTRPYLKPSTWSAGFTARQKHTGRVRTARSLGRMLKTMADHQMTMEEFVATLSPEELVAGKLKDKNGGFAGRAPTWVPREFHRACIRELLERGQFLWRNNYLMAIESMTKIATGQIKGATPGERIKAATFVIERLEGKVPIVIDLKEEAPWKLAIEDIVADVPESALLRVRQARQAALEEADREDIVDAELVPEPEPVPPPPPRSRRATRTRR